MKVLARMLLIIVAAVAVIGITIACEHSMRPPQERMRERTELRRRAPEPRLSRYPQLLIQLAFYLLLGITGRYVLRLRL